MNRKCIQISSASNMLKGTTLFALFNDGTIWFRHAKSNENTFGEWQFLDTAEVEDKIALDLPS